MRQIHRMVTRVHRMVTRGGLILGLAIAVGNCGGGGPTSTSVNTQASTVSGRASTVSGRLWILAEEATCAGTVGAFWQCVLASTNFNSWVSQWSGGDTLTWGGFVTGNPGCVFALNGSCTQNGYDVPTTYNKYWQPALQCAENFAKFPLQYNDVILVVQATPTANGYGCSDSSPSDALVNVPGGGSFNIRGAFVSGGTGGYGRGSSAQCGAQTGISLHEVYEATTNGLSGDNCLYNCAYTPATSFYNMTCGGASYDFQKLSPPSAWTCTSSLQCNQLTCTPSCATSFCGGPDGCGGICGCPAGQHCDASGTCSVANVPTCPPSWLACNTTNGTGWCGAGYYCGKSGMTYAASETLYYCSHAGQQNPSARACNEECHFRPGLDDQCWEDTSNCSYWRSYFVDACGWDYVNGNPRINYQCYYGSKSIHQWCAPGRCAWGSVNDYCH
jgi:hypothetical protein